MSQAGGLHEVSTLALGILFLNQGGYIKTATAATVTGGSRAKARAGQVPEGDSRATLLAKASLVNFLFTKPP